MATQSDTTPAPAVTINLVDLLAEHRQMMVAFEALYEADNGAAGDAQELLYRELLETRKEIIACRPATLQEVAIKAGLMMQDRAFLDWDADGGVEVSEIIGSLIPAGLEAEGVHHAA